MINDLPFYFLVVPVVVIVGMSKGGFGGGLGLLAVPVLALVVDPRVAAAVLLPILCVMDAVGLWKFRGSWDVTSLKIIIPGAFLGTVVGAASFRLTNADMIRLFVGMLSIYFVIHYVWGLRALEKAVKRPPNRIKGTVCGAIAGFASYIAHAGGPPVAIFLVPLQLPKATFASTTILFFAIINFVKLIPYAWLGQINSTTLVTSIALLPLAPIGVLIGIYLHHRVSEKLFYRITCVFLLIAGIKLTVEGVGGLF